MTNDTVNGNGVACNGLNLEAVISNGAVCIEGAVDGEDVAILIGNLHITILSVVNLGDNAGYVVLTFGVGVVLFGCAKSENLLDGESGISCGIFNGRLSCRNVSAANVALLVAVSVNVLGAFGSVGALGNSYDPTVLDLRSAAVLAEDTVNGNGVACNGCTFYSIVTVCAGGAISAVDGEDVALSIGNSHVTVLGVVNFGDNAGYNYLALGVGVVLHRSTGVDSILNRGGLGDGHDPTILNLRSAVVLTNDTKDNYVVACNRCIFHSVVSCGTVCTVSAVNGENVAKLVNDLHVTVGGVVNLRDDTCNEVLLGGVLVVAHGSTEIDDVLNGLCGLGKLQGEFLGSGLVAAGCGNSNDNVGSCIRNGDGQLAVSNCNKCFVVGGPGKNNLRIYSNGELYNCIAGVGGAELELIHNVGDHFLVRLFNLVEVFEAINAYRNEIRIAVVQNENTGSICSPTEVLKVSCINGCLVILNKGGGEVGNVCTNVSFLVVELELEVIGGATELLTGDLNALNGYERTYIVLQAAAVSECFGDVNDVEFVDGGINDSCNAALDFLHAGVRRYRTGNLNDHTNFDAEVCNRVSIHLVGVVAALAVKVSQEEVVTGVACCLGVDTNNDTLDNNVAFGHVDVFLKGSQHVFRNSQVKGLGSSLVAALNGSGQNVCKLFGRLFIYVYDVGVFVLYFNGNLVGINRPLNGVNGAEDGNLGGYFKVGSGDGLVFVEVVNVVSSCLYVVLFCRGIVNGGNGGTLFCGSGSLAVADLCKVLQKIARSERTYTKNKGQQNN